jgi:hypothetical protein
MPPHTVVFKAIENAYQHLFFAYTSQRFAVGMASSQWPNLFAECLARPKRLW